MASTQDRSSGVRSEPTFRPQDMRRVALPVLHRDPDFLVLDKPSGLLSIPGRGPHAQDSVITRVAAEHPEAEGSLMVHRLDMDCSGLMVVALHRFAQRELARQFELRVVKKVYQALIEGRLEADSGRISLAFRLDPENRPHQIFDPVNGKPGETDFQRLGFERLDIRGLDIEGLDCERVEAHRQSVEQLGTEYSVDGPDADILDSQWITRIRFEPITGRTHQLRLHASHAAGLGRPILGDRLYGNARLAPRLMLHAHTLRLLHPRSGDSMTFVAPLPF